VYFLGTGLPDELHELFRCGTPDYRIIDNHHHPVLQHTLDRVELRLDFVLPHFLSRLDKCPADVVLRMSPISSLEFTPLF